MTGNYVTLSPHLSLLNSLEAPLSSGLGWAVSHFRMCTKDKRLQLSRLQNKFFDACIFDYRTDTNRDINSVKS